MQRPAAKPKERHSVILVPNEDEVEQEAVLRRPAAMPEEWRRAEIDRALLVERAEAAPKTRRRGKGAASD